MQQESNIVIADTSCFILLDKINELNILQRIFHSVLTTEEISAEYGKTLPDWVVVKSVASKEYQQLLQLEIDGGEASAIALSIENENSLLIPDDRKARKIAEKLNLRYTGTIGILLKAKQMGVIAAVKPLVEKIQKTNFYFSEGNYLELLRMADEA